MGGPPSASSAQALSPGAPDVVDDSGESDGSGASDAPDGSGVSDTSDASDAPPKSVAPGARPGDAAREALRRATAVDSAPAARTGAEARSGARPGDIAREALRAAREEARRLRSEETDGGGEQSAESEGGGAGPRRRSARTSASGARGRRGTAHPTSSDRASQQRRLNDLLADAFRLPPDVAAETGEPSPPGADTDAEATAHERHADRSPGRRGRLPYPEFAESPERTEGPEHSTYCGHPEHPDFTGHFAHPAHPEGSPRPGYPSYPEDSSDLVLPRHPQHVEDASRPELPARPEGPADPGYPAPAEDPLHPEDPPYPASEEETAADEPFTVGSLVTGLFTTEPRSGAAELAESPEPPEPPESFESPVSSAPWAGTVPADRLPRSMGSPGRDGELRRTFPAFPARVSDEGAFAETWWGNAWITALEEGALDAARLARGRTYAGRGHVDAVTVTPGLVLAYVHGSRPRPYRVQIRVRTLTDGDWDRFVDAAAERPGHIAALLDKEVPKSLADCGVPLLPGPGELEPHCSCPDFGHPCKHAAALCYQTARLLDQDPFVLFLLRGRGERGLLDALSRRNATRAARAAQDREPARPAGVRASDAVARRVLPPLPAPLPPPAHPGQPPAYPGVPGGPDAFALDQLATDAAARAHALLTSGRDPVAELTLWQDAVRVAAARPGSGLTAATRALYSSLASATGRTPADLARAVAAWRQGGFEALGVLEEPWDPPAGRFDRARPLLMAADFPAFRPWRNHLTHPRGHAQLRLGRNGLWYAYESEPGHDDWWPRGTPDLDPVGALTGLGAPGEL